MQSGILHAEDKDYKTAYGLFSFPLLWLPRRIGKAWT
jgi:hypothetical protein